MEWYKVQKDRLVLFVGFLTIELYWPRFTFNNSDIGLWFHTHINYKRHVERREWEVTRAFVIKILGFGIGLAWKHCDNPSIEKLRDNG